MIFQIEKLDNKTQIVKHIQYMVMSSPFATKPSALFFF